MNQMKSRLSGGADLPICQQEGGDKMSLEAIREIQQVEAEMDAARTEARTRAQQAVDQARREGQALLRQGQEASAALRRELLDRARREAEQRRQEILRQAEADGQALADRAEAGMNAAVQLIMERVVESGCPL